MFRWDDAYKLLDEMLANKVSNIHQVIGQMIRGDFDDDGNWQMVEYIFDKLNSEGYGFGIRFYNALLETLWWLGQKERAARVLKEATKRGLFPELFRKNKLVFSVDVHRYHGTYFQSCFFPVSCQSYLTNEVGHFTGCGKVALIHQCQFGSTICMRCF